MKSEKYRKPLLKLWRRLLFIPDKPYLKVLYWLYFGEKLDLKNPETYNEKIQWLKIYDKRFDYSNLVDKYEVRKYVAETIGEEYLIPVYGVWDSFDEIPFDTLPDQFVLKCTHDCGSVKICKDKKTFDWVKAGKYFKKRLAKNYYNRKRESPYKNIKPRIIAEKLMEEESGNDLKDYKVYCFNGEAKVVDVIFDRFTSKPKSNFYSPQWDFMSLAHGKFAVAPHIHIEKPQCLEKMLSLAQKLSAGKIHLRVDFYITGSNIYFGELTFYTTAGFGKFYPSGWDKTFGDWITLPPNTTL